MSVEEKQIVETLVRAFNTLPDGKNEFMLGYAEGVAAMHDQKKKRNSGTTNHSVYTN